MADYNLEGPVWASSTITWSFATANLAGQPASFSSTFTPGIFEQEIVAALADWSSVADVHFVQVTDSSSSDIRFGLGTFDGPFGILAETSYFYDGSGHFVPDVTVSFDQAETYSATSQGLTLSGSGGVEFEATALHEIGHALGLDHYNTSAAIMNAVANPSVTDLTQSDIDGIHALYGAAPAGAGAQTSGLGWQAAIIQDFNADGHDDILWVNANGTAKVDYLNNGTVLSETSFTTPGVGWSIIGHGDYNHDGNTDLLWQNTTTGAAEETLLAAGQVTSTLSFGVMDSNWKLISSGDFNGDGSDDLLWRNSSTGQGLEWFTHNGLATSWLYVGVMSTDWKVASTTDLNHDGTADILWQNTKTGDGIEWFSQNGYAVAWHAFGTMGPTWDVVATADFNHDGQTDLLWQNKTDGHLIEWFINQSGFAFDWRDLGTPHPNDKVVGLLDVNSPNGPTILLQNSVSGTTSEMASSADHALQAAADLFKLADTSQVDHSSTVGLPDATTADAVAHLHSFGLLA